MRKNRVTYRNLSCNVKGWDRYHISKRGRLYRYYPKRKVWMVMNGTISRGRYKLNRVKVNSLFRDKEKGFTNKELSIK